MYYIGKGVKGRSTEFKIGRPRKYLEDMRKYGPPVVVILREGLTETEAYEIENKLITQARARGDDIYNRTDGFEKSEIGDMPWRSLLFSKQKVHPKYKQIIHLVSAENKGSYSLAITIIESAIKMHCSCNEVLGFLDSVKIGGAKEKNGYILIGEDEAVQIAPWYKHEIIQKTKKAKDELQEYSAEKS